MTKAQKTVEIWYELPLILGDTYCEVWLKTPNHLMEGACPTDWIKAGRFDEVIAAAVAVV